MGRFEGNWTTLCPDGLTAQRACLKQESFGLRVSGKGLSFELTANLVEQTEMPSAAEFA